MSKYYISDTELYHWKYIKRERKNGRWVYYYDNPKLNKAKTDVVGLNLEIGDAQRAKRYAELTKKEIEAMPSIPIKSIDDLNKGLKLAGKLQKANKTIRDADNTIYWSNRKKDEALKKLEKMKVKTLPGRTVTKGLNAVSKLLSNTKKTAKKAKKAVKKAVKR